MQSFVTSTGLSLPPVFPLVWVEQRALGAVSSEHTDSVTLCVDNSLVYGYLLISQ